MGAREGVGRAEGVAFLPATVPEGLRDVVVEVEGEGEAVSPAEAVMFTIVAVGGMVAEGREERLCLGEALREKEEEEEDPPELVPPPAATKDEADAALVAVCKGGLLEVVAEESSVREGKGPEGVAVEGAE